ncbi:xylulokinase [Paramicrobacterium chengjingii]|uniref:xylulokinase n=1 Tax=Paramicrobacterium chengjingii TaxID=2769067 RepID=UPI00142364CC|nr:FGGY-family carbohydrate kinase [Microbacterium chengjingii]
MRSPLALAIDVGSSAVRAAAVEPEGEIVASARVQRLDAHSGLSFDPELLWQQLKTACLSLDPLVRSRVASLAIAAHIGTVFVDVEGHSIGPGRGWADTDGVAALRTALGAGEAELLRASGRPAVTGGAAAAALWLRTERPEEFRRVVRIVSPKDYLVSRLTGIVSVDHTTAAYTGVSRIRARDWDDDLLTATRLDADMFPLQVASTDVVESLSTRVAAAIGLPTGTAVVSGGPDGTVGAMFVSGERFDVIVDVAGTTDVLVRRVGSPEAAPVGAMVNPFPLGGFSAGGATGMTGGALARWAELLGYADSSAAAADLGAGEALLPGADGLRIRPTYSGSRFPRWCPEDSGMLWGQRTHHGPKELVQAAVEGAAFVVREGVDLLDPKGQVPIALAGGAARSRLLAQLRADVLNRQIMLCSEPDVSVLGAALLAFRGVAADVGGTFDVANHPSEIVSPDPERSAAYAEVFNDWQQ